MRRVIYDKRGEPKLYVTGAGVVYGLDNQVRGFVQDERLADERGALRGWFDGGFLWDLEGYVVGFVKGAKPPQGLDLPKTQPLRVKPQPTPALLAPFLQMQPKPELHLEWSEGELEEVFLGPFV